MASVPPASREKHHGIYLGAIVRKILESRGNAELGRSIGRLLVHLGQKFDEHVRNMYPSEQLRLLSRNAPTIKERQEARDEIRDIERSAYRHATALAKLHWPLGRVLQVSWEHLDDIQRHAAREVAEDHWRPIVVTDPDVFRRSEGIGPILTLGLVGSQDDLPILIDWLILCDHEPLEDARMAAHAMAALELAVLAALENHNLLDATGAWLFMTPEERSALDLGRTSLGLDAAIEALKHTPRIHELNRLSDEKDLERAQAIGHGYRGHAEACESDSSKYGQEVDRIKKECRKSLRKYFSKDMVKTFVWEMGRGAPRTGSCSVDPSAS